jgi:hypothetical protein
LCLLRGVFSRGDTQLPYLVVFLVGIAARKQFQWDKTDHEKGKSAALL